jgi:hypothetical protein
MHAPGILQLDASRPQGPYEFRPPHGRDLKNTGKGPTSRHLREPDIDILDAENVNPGEGQRVDVFHPNTGEVRSDGAEGIACWFIDTDYNGRASTSVTPISWAPTIPTRP